MEWPVWYHTEAKQLGGGYKKGKLTVEPSGARLETDDGAIEIAPIRSVGRERVSLWLYWAAVEYGRDDDVRHLYVGDRRMLGWRGILGSNGEIENSLRAAQGGGAPPPPPA